MKSFGSAPKIGGGVEWIKFAMESRTEQVN